MALQAMDTDAILARMKERIDRMKERIDRDLAKMKEEPAAKLKEERAAEVEKQRIARIASMVRTSRHQY
jgi:sugar-specific transcriptional regulator TrmB